MDRNRLIDPKEASLYAKSIARQHAKTPRIARAIILVVFAMMASLIWWASVTEIKEVARAQGELTPTGPMVEIEHAEGGKIASVLKSPGDTVLAGDIIATLSDARLVNEQDQLEIQAAKLRSDIQRFRALLDELPRDVNPPLGPSSRTEVVQLAKTQRAAFMARRASQAKRIRQFAESVRLSAIIRDNSKRRFLAAQDREASYQTLADKGIISRVDFADIVAETQSLQNDYLSAEAALQRARADHQDAESNYEELLLDSQEKNLTGLSEAVTELAQIDRQIADNTRKLATFVMKSPTDGIIQTMNGGGPEEILPPGASLATILPTGLDLVAEVELSPRDVGHVKPGDRVLIRITSFDQKRFGTIDGIVEKISATTETDPKDQPFFRVTVQLDRKTIGDGEFERALRAGMEVNAEIITLSRTIVEYLLKPIDATLSKALNER